MEQNENKINELRTKSPQLQDNTFTSLLFELEVP